MCAGVAPRGEGSGTLSPGDQVTQLTWTVLPQGFQDSPRQVLSRYLGPVEHAQVNIIQCVDDILLWAPAEDTAQEGTRAY